VVAGDAREGAWHEVRYRQGLFSYGFHAQESSLYALGGRSAAKDYVAGGGTVPVAATPSVTVWPLEMLWPWGWKVIVGATHGT